jgi:mgtE-like transporter
MKIPHEKFSLIYQAIIELLVGFVYVFNLESLKEFRVILFLIPALMSLRGAIYGVLALRITTLLYLGKAKPSLKDALIRIEIFFSFLRSMFASFILATLAFIFDKSFFEGALSYGMLLTLSLLTNLLTFLIVAIPVSIAMFYYFKKGRVLEFIGTPFVSSFADIVTPVILFLSIIPSFSIIFQTFFLTFLLILTATFLTILYLRKSSREAYFSIFKFSEIRENFYTISLMHTLYASISGFGGLFYARTLNLSQIQSLLVIVPAYNALLGSLGGILSSKVSVSLHLGTSNSLLKIFRDTILAYASFFAGITIVALFTNPIGISIALIASFFTCIVISLISYYVSIAEFKKGFDPDTYTFPMISSLGDLLAPASVIIVTLVLIR